MKHSVLLLLAIFLLSCSKEETSTNSDSKFSPPEWITGTWENRTELNGTTTILRYSFDSDNIIEETISNGSTIISVDYKSFYRDDSFSITESKDSNKYVVKTDLKTESFDQSVHREFNKVSDNQIEFTSIAGLSTGLLFTKQ